MTAPFTFTANAAPVDALLRGTEWAAVSREVSLRDETFAAALGDSLGDYDMAQVEYFRTGMAIADAHAQILRSRFRDLAAISLLDFASGYGRVTRFYRSLLEPSRICVADLQEDAVDFQRRTLGVEGFVSRVDPNDLAVARRFDAVFATSLFTHLPAGLFEAWLQFLLRLLRPGGILVFSTLDRALHDGGAPPGDPAFHFERRSESRARGLGRGMAHDRLDAVAGGEQHGLDEARLAQPAEHRRHIRRLDEDEIAQPRARSAVIEPDRVEIRRALLRGDEQRRGRGHGASASARLWRATSRCSPLSRSFTASSSKYPPGFCSSA